MSLEICKNDEARLMSWVNKNIIFDYDKFGEDKFEIFEKYCNAMIEGVEECEYIDLIVPDNKNCTFSKSNLFAGISLSISLNKYEKHKVLDRIEKLSRNQIEDLMKIFIDEFSKLADDASVLHKNKIKINFIGRINVFPKEVHQSMLKLMEITRNYSDYQVNFAMAYGGREEVIDAVKKVAEQIKNGGLNISQVNEEVFEKYSGAESVALL